MKKLLKVLVVCLAMAMMLAGCGNGGNGGTSNEGGQTDGENSGIPTDQTLIMVTTQDPQSFNPDFKSDDGAWPINQNIFNRLVKLGNNTKINLDLAESYEFSEDGMQLTFHLHDGVKWHDGEPFTSADVKWTYDTAIAEKWSKADNLSNIDSIECPDDNTVVMNLKTPDVSIIAKLAWYGTFIMPKHLYEGTDTATNPYNQNPVGTGPFKFVEYKAGQYVTLERNEDFWGDKAIAKTLKFAIISDDNTLWEAFMNGEVDDLCQMIPAAHANDLDGNDNYTFYSEMGINRTYITFNLKDERFQDQRVREAFALAIDNQGCWDRTAGGNGEPSEYMISHAFTKYLDEDSKLPKRNVEEAMKLLEEAGYTKDADGYYMHVTLDAFESGNWKDLAAIIQPVLAAAVEKTDIESANTEETAVEDSESAAAQTQGTESGAENSSDGNADSSDNSSTDVKVEFEEPDTTGNDTTVTISPEPTNIPDDNADGGIGIGFQHTSKHIGLVSQGVGGAKYTLPFCRAYRIITAT